MTAQTTRFFVVALFSDGHKELVTAEEYSEVAIEQATDFAARKPAGVQYVEVCQGRGKFGACPTRRVRIFSV